MSRRIAVLLILWLATTAHAGGPTAVETIAPYLDAQTVAVLHFRVDRVDVPALVKAGRQLGADAKELQRLQEEMQGKLEQARDAGVREVFFVVTLGGFPNSPGYAVIPLGEKGDADKVANLLRGFDRSAETRRLGKALLVGPEQAIRRVELSDAVVPKDLVQAFASCQDADGCVVALLPPTLRTTLGETLPQLPAELGGDSSKFFSEGFRWAALGVTWPPRAGFRLHVQAADADAAKRMREVVEKGLALLKAREDIAKDIPQFRQLADRLLPKVEGDRLELAWGVEEVEKLVLPLVEKTRESARRMQSMNNLKQIGLAMHNYHDLNKSFPPRYTAAKGKKLLSWRVHILPYIEQDHLYKQFKLNEPWDSPHNKKLIEHMPPTYRSPQSKAPAGRTTYLVPAGKDTLFPGPKGLQFRDIPDGTSNTILTVEANDDHAVTWTAPDDLEIDPQQPLRGLTGQYGGQGFQAGFADGSVRFITSSIDAQTLNALFSRHDGMVINNIP